MRAQFVRTLVELAEEDPQIILLTGDLGFMALEPFSERFPDRFVNVGVQEQNMVGVATGLAEAGFRPYVYSIVNFAALRPYEFIRNGPILHQLPVHIVGMGGGYDYGSAGATHHGLEDLGLMRLQPGIVTIAPADGAQARTALLVTHREPGPVYLSLCKDDSVVIPGLEGRFALGHAEQIGHGTDLLIIATGAAVAASVTAAELLGGRGIRCTVLVCASLTPAPTGDLVAALDRFPLALTVEVHNIVGGLGSLVSEVVAETGVRCRIVRCGVRSSPDSVSGSAKFMQHRAGLSPEGIVRSALQAIETLPVGAL